MMREDSNRFLLNYEALGEALIDGPRHELLAVCQGDKNAVKEVCGELGRLFEQYVSVILSEAFGASFVKLDSNNQTKRADGIVFGERNVVVLEFKSARFRATSDRTLLTLQERADAVRAIVSKGIEQLAATILALWNGEIGDDPYPNRDWTMTQIIPVLITYEKLPLVWGSQRIFGNLEGPITKLPSRGLIGRLRYLSVDDLEVIPDLAEAGGFAQLLAGWAADAHTCDRPLGDYLFKTNHNIKRDYFLGRSKELLGFLRDKLKIASIV